jgi:hypothetical protein
MSEILTLPICFLFEKAKAIVEGNVKVSLYSTDQALGHEDVWGVVS